MAENRNGCTHPPLIPGDSRLGARRRLAGHSGAPIGFFSASGGALRGLHHGFLRSWDLPSGKHTKNYGKSQFLMGKLTINGHFQ